jgi:hypothetical protein
MPPAYNVCICLRLGNSLRECAELYMRMGSDLAIRMPYDLNITLAGAHILKSMPVPVSVTQAQAAHWHWQAATSKFKLNLNLKATTGFQL